jgi:uncharacterized membrane protein YkvA (DUF1232 family)
MWKRLKTAAASFRREIRFYELVRQHPRTPRIAKALIGIAIAYALSPIDLIPDFIPVLGHVDDLIIVPLLVFAAVKLIPEDVIRECRANVESEIPSAPAEGGKVEAPQ